MILAFAVIEALLFGVRLTNGGMYQDDWPIAAVGKVHGMGWQMSQLLTGWPGRPVGDIALALTQALVGINPHLHALVGMLLLLFAVTTGYLLLRRLGVSVVVAFAVSLLFMAFPFSDSSWLWYAASFMNLSIGCMFLGAVVSLDSLEHTGRARTVRRLTALVLFAASILAYQVTTVLLCLTILLYWRRVPIRHAIKLWVTDLIVVVLSIGLPWVIGGSQGTARGVAMLPPGQEWVHAKDMFGQGATLLTWAFMPFGSPHRNVVLSIAFALAAAALLFAWFHRRSPEALARYRPWFVLVGVGAVVVICGYLIFVPGPIWIYQPLGQGGNNRVNSLPAFGYALGVVGLAGLVGSMASELLRGRGTKIATAALAICLCLSAAVFVGYVRRTRADVRSWDLGSLSQRAELAQIKTLGRPPHGTVLYTFGGVGAVANGVWGFRVTSDLLGAYQYLWDDGTIRAYPIFEGTQMQCTRTGLIPNGEQANGDGPSDGADYGHIVFYDFQTKREQRIVSQAVCEAAVKSFVPGFYLDSDPRGTATA